MNRILGGVLQRKRSMWEYACKNGSTNLSASIAEPSSNSSSTVPMAESFFDSLLEESWHFFLNNKALSMLCFLGGVGGWIELSGGIMSTTMQVVSSFSPRVLKASYRRPYKMKKAIWAFIITQAFIKAIYYFRAASPTILAHILF